MCRTLVTALVALTVLEAALAHPTDVELAKRANTLEWAVVGDSWASGVAYNAKNVYSYTDTQFCYRTTEAWGAQMEADKSWVDGDMKFNFAACGGTLMDNLKDQMRNKAGKPSVVWGMFGGNNAKFGAIVRACIYQPIPGGWGKYYDEDPNGEGYCKKYIAEADKYIKDPTAMRQETQKALNDILDIAQDDDHKKDQFDLYLSSYVPFWDATTDDCDKWTFAHPRVSAGSPKVVKELRQIMNDRVQQVNNLQGDIVKNYALPKPALKNYKVHNVQPGGIFDTHRFCEKGATFEDQFYGDKNYFWNLQYKDDKAAFKSKDVNGVTQIDEDLTDQQLNDAISILSMDNGNAETPPGDKVGVAQAGFGWTARPFHPKYAGHTLLKDFFIKNMQDDKIPGVKGSAPATPVGPPQPDIKCANVGDSKYVARDTLAGIINDKFCPEAVKQGTLNQNSGSIARGYNQKTMEEVNIAMDWRPGLEFKPNLDDCKKYLLATLTDGCNGNDPSGNPANYKAGGSVQVEDVKYRIEPVASRQPAKDGVTGGCFSQYDALFNQIEVWGHGFASSDFGSSLKDALGGCAPLPDTWSFDYGIGNDGREWTARIRTGVFQKHCVGGSVGGLFGHNDLGCGGSG